MRLRFLATSAGLAVAVAVLGPALAPGRLTLLITAVLYFPVVLGISMLAGHANQVSGGHAAFFGTGAYVTGVLSAHDYSPWLSMTAGTAATVAVALLLGLPVLRLRGHVLVLATISLNIIFVELIRQAGALTGGSSGLLGIQPLSLAGTELTEYEQILYLALAWAVLSAVGTNNLLHSVAGRALKCLGTSEPAAASMGVSRTRYATFLFCWSGLLAGGSGALYAEWMRFISPASFGLHLSITLLVMAVIGGVGSISGAAAGTVGYLLLSDVLNTALAPNLGARSPIVEGLLFGVVLLALAIYRPGGLASLAGLVPVGRRARSKASNEVDGANSSVPDAPLGSVPNHPGELVLSGITQRFGGLRVLDSIDLVVPAGQVVALVGPNGAGKSTLLNIVSGLLRPTEGQVSFGDGSLNGRVAHAIAAQGVSRTFQTPQLVGSMGVVDNVAVGLHIRHSSRVSTLAAVLGLNVRDERRIRAQADLATARAWPTTSPDAGPISALPFGRRRWTELARATAAMPRLILLDEPASGLTAGERDHLVELIRGYQRSGATVVLVEHDMDLVRRVAERTVVLHQGVLLADGPTDQTLSDERVQAAYLGATAENVIHAPVASNAGRLLVVRDLQVGYGDLHVVRGADLTVRPGEITALLGPNGAGKTTLLRGVTGQLRASGQVMLDGDEIAGSATDDIARRGLVVVPEGRELVPGLTVGEHLRLSQGSTDAGGDRRPDDVTFDLAAVHALFPILAERSAQRATSLSGGQQQMLAIARALLMQPRVLLIDEPLLGLSPVAVAGVLSAIRDLANRGLGVVLAEQQELTVRPYVDRVLRIDHGTLTTEVPANPNGPTDAPGQRKKVSS